MNASGLKPSNRQEEVSIISRSLKGLAKELNIPIIALSQLNRGVEGRTGDKQRPHLSDLRESGAIEQDADMVILIHRPEYYQNYEDKDGNSLRGLAEIIIAKHRNGATGELKLRFSSDKVRFEDYFDAGFDFYEKGEKMKTFESKINNATGASSEETVQVQYTEEVPF
jgi:replicative DNA helicase